jgi:hypothetical protein
MPPKTRTLACARADDQKLKSHTKKLDRTAATPSGRAKIDPKRQSAGSEIMVEEGVPSLVVNTRHDFISGGTEILVETSLTRIRYSSMKTT